MKKNDTTISSQAHDRQSSNASQLGISSEALKMRLWSLCMAMCLNLATQLAEGGIEYHCKDTCIAS